MADNTPSPEDELNNDLTLQWLRNPPERPWGDQENSTIMNPQLMGLQRDTMVPNIGNVIDQMAEPQRAKALDDWFKRDPRAAHEYFAPKISPSEIESMAQERSAASPYGSMQSSFDKAVEAERQNERWRTDPKTYAEVARQGAEMSIPGVAVAGDLYRGDYPQAAWDATATAIPFGLGKFAQTFPRIAKVAYPAYAAATVGMVPEAVGGDSHFPWLADDKESQKAADAEWQSTRVKGQDGKTDPVATQNARTALVKESRIVWQKKQDENRSLAGFEKNHADDINNLSEDERNSYNSILVPGDAAATLKQKADFLKNKSDELTESKKSLFDKVPGSGMAVAGISSILSGAVPFYSIRNKANAIKGAQSNAQTAFNKSIQARAPKSAIAARDDAGNQLSQQMNIHPLEYAKLAGAPLIPYVLGNVIPNYIDTQRLKDHPDYPAYKNAWAQLNPTTPEGKDALRRALIEGFSGEGVGGLAGVVSSHYPQVSAAGKGTLLSINKAQAAAAEIAKQKELAAALKATQQKKPRLKAPGPPPIPGRIP